MSGKIEISKGVVGETWTQTGYHRWAVCGYRTPRLQVTWVSSTGEINWRGLESVAVTEEEYLK